MSCYIAGTGRYLPKRVIKNSFFEKSLETTDKWIFSRTGIKQRRFSDKGNFYMGAQSAMDALKNARVNAEDLDLIICSTITPDHAFPATACLIQNYIGAKKAIAFDISIACAGFIYAMMIADDFIKSGRGNNVLIVSSEKMSSTLNFKDRSTCILFGDGAGAIVLKKSFFGNIGISKIKTGSDGTCAHHLIKNKFLEMNGTEVYTRAVEKMTQSAKEVMPDKIDWFIPHQANIRIIDEVRKNLKIPKSKVYTNLDKYGNTSSASIPIVLDEMNRKGMIKNDDVILMTAFGAGWAWGSAVVKW